MATEAVTTLEQVKKFHTLQEERVLTYNLFEEGFQAYLRGAPHYNFPMYRQLVDEITQTFLKISADIIKIIENVKTENQTAITNIMEHVQTEEKKKLQLTAELQVAKQNVVDNPEEEIYKTEVADLQKRMQDQIVNINEYLEELKFETEDLYTENCDR